jgi:type IX secretion system PorP/SprF family membrane protein
MKNVSKLWVYFAFLMLKSYSHLYGQDPVYSQFYNAHMQLNPALCGNTNSPLIQLNYRNQWPALPSAYSTYAVSVDKYFPKRNSGFGLLVLADNAGDGALTTSGVSGFYSYRLKIKDKTYIKGGMQLGFNQLALNWQKLSFGDAIDIRNGPISPGGTPYPSKEINNGNNSISYFTASSGVVLYNPQYYIGASLHNMNQPDISFLRNTSNTGNDQLPMRLSLHGGYQYIIKKGNKLVDATFLSPNITFQRQRGFNQIMAGAYLNVDKIQGGVWYRHTAYNGDAVITSVGVKKDFFKITYSFDFTVSNLSVKQGGGHEIGIILNFDHIYPPKQDYNDCFAIFR